ncbi:hypothetical protein THICB2_230061 [Thiomonas sp. CB2]|nr:hypothetical protein THICB2_230061 [Thiomonas sp. CB2]VDY16889.1 protein of unknown function [Thiomonas sp. CB2]
MAVLSRVASFSAYHFHRQFTGYVGVNTTVESRHAP